MSLSDKYLARINTLRASMAEAGIGGMFLAPSGDMEYVTGLRRRPPDPTEAVFTGDDLLGILITAGDIVTFLPPSAAMHGVEGQLMQCPWLCENIVRLPKGVDQPEEGYRWFGKLGLENATVALPRRGQAMTVINLGHYYPAMKFVNAEIVTDAMRPMRDPDDLEKVRRAAEITDKVFWSVLEKLHSGDVEADIIREIDLQMVKHGAEGPSFNTMLLTGSPGCGSKDFPVPSGGAPGTSGGVLTPGTVLAFDFGVVFDGWCSDFGRTAYVGEPSEKQKADHKLVADSQRAALEMMIAGQVTGHEADAAARKVLEDAGRGEEFIHGLGHGVGVDIHEHPGLAKNDTTVLQEGMTVAVEPSLWVNREYFVRVEDVCVVTPEGGKSLHGISTYEIFVIE